MDFLQKYSGVSNELHDYELKHNDGLWLEEEDMVSYVRQRERQDGIKKEEADGRQGNLNTNSENNATPKEDNEDQKNEVFRNLGKDKSMRCGQKNFVSYDLPTVCSDCPDKTPHLTGYGRSQEERNTEKKHTELGRTSDDENEDEDEANEAEENHQDIEEPRRPENGNLENKGKEEKEIQKETMERNYLHLQEEVLNQQAKIQ